MHLCTFVLMYICINAYVYLFLVHLLEGGRSVLLSYQSLLQPLLIVLKKAGNELF
jgi:hypothetical protein